MREKEAQKAVSSEFRHFAFRNGEPRARPQRAQMQGTKIPQPRAQVRQQCEPSDQYYRKFHSMGRSGNHTYSQKYTHLWNAHYPKTRPQTQQYHHQSIPHDKSSGMNSYTHKQYHSKSLPRNAYRSRSGLNQHLQYPDMIWTGQIEGHPPAFYRFPPPPFITQIPPLLVQNFQVPVVAAHTVNYMREFNRPEPGCSQQYSQLPPIAPSLLPNAHGDWQLHQGVYGSQYSPINQRDSTGLWRPYQHHFVAEAAPENSRLQQVEQGASSPTGTGKMNRYEEPISGDSWKNRHEQK